MSLCFFGATDENLTKSDSGMGVGKISIQRQRMFTFGDALRRALGEYLDMLPTTYGRAHGPGPTTGLLVNFASAAAKAAMGSVTKRNRALDHVRARRSNERVDIVGIGG